MEIKAESIRAAIDPLENVTYITIGVKDGIEARKYLNAHKDKPLRVKFTEWREKRSLSANSYSWLLLGKLSEKLGIPPEEIYWNLIKDVGGNYTTATVPLGSVDMLRKTWGQNGLGWRVDIIGASGPGLVDVILYYGSSVYDTAQMSRLIDLIIEECKAQEIEYLPPERLAAMLEDWDAKQTHKGSGD